MIHITFGNKVVRSAPEVHEALAHLGSPTVAGVDKANSFRVTSGREPARGWLLMDRGDLDDTDFLNSLHSLTFTLIDQLTNTQQKITWHNLVITTEPVNLTPAHLSEDPTSVYLVEVSDSRWRVASGTFCQTADTMYNVSSNSTGSAPTTYLAASIVGGITPWTWAGMVGDLWGLMAAQLGTYPGLPFTPDGAPVGWIFRGVSAWDALCDVLDRLGCAVRANLTRTFAQGQYSIVQVGTADDPAAQIVAAALAANRKIHDAEPLTVIRGKIPYGVRVHFHKMLEEPTQIPPWLQNSGPYTVDVVGPDAASAEPGIYHPIWDDLPAIYDAGATLTNGAALATRAAERAADYYRMLRFTGGGRYWHRYTGLLAITPGSTLKSATWHATAGGVFTDIVRLAEQDDRPKDYTSAGTAQDLVRLGFPSSAGTGGGAGGSGTETLIWFNCTIEDDVVIIQDSQNITAVVRLAENTYRATFSVTFLHEEAFTWSSYSGYDPVIMKEVSRTANSLTIQTSNLLDVERFGVDIHGRFGSGGGGGGGGDCNECETPACLANLYCVDFTGITDGTLSFCDDVFATSWTLVRTAPGGCEWLSEFRGPDDSFFVILTYAGGTWRLAVSYAYFGWNDMAVYTNVGWDGIPPLVMTLGGSDNVSCTGWPETVSVTDCGGSGGSGPPACSVCDEPPDTFCISFPGITHSYTTAPCCANLLQSPFSLNRNGLSCLWEAFVSDVGIDGSCSDSYLQIDLHLAGTTMIVRVFSVILDSPSATLLVEYSADLSGWNCVTDLVADLVAVAPGVDIYNCDWPLTIPVTVGPCAAPPVASPPSVTFSDMDLCQDATTVVITGTGFDVTIPSNNSVVFNLGAAGTVISATATTLTVLFSTQPTSTGALTAIVVNANGSSSPAVQVATVIDCVSGSISVDHIGANSGITAASIDEGNSAAANTLAVVVVWSDDNTGTLSCTYDGRAMSQAVSIPWTDGSVSGRLVIFYLDTGPLPSSVIMLATITGGSPTGIIGIFGYLITNLASNLLDRTASATGTSGTATSGVTATTTAADEAAIAVLAYATGGSPDMDAPFNLDNNLNNGAYYVVVGNRVLTSTGTVEATDAGTGSFYVGAVATFK